MHAEDATINHSAQSQVVKHVAAVAPHIHRAIFPEAFVVKPVYLGNLPAFVVATNERDAIGIAHLVRQQEKEGLYAVVATVDEIT